MVVGVGQVGQHKILWGTLHQSEVQVQSEVQAQTEAPKQGEAEVQGEVGPSATQRQAQVQGQNRWRGWTTSCWDGRGG